MQMKQKILFSFLAGCLAAAAVSAQTVPDPVYLKKTATPLGDDRMKLTLESFVSGNNVASDIVVLMDLSASMDGNVTGSPEVYSRERDKVISQTSGWTYSSLNYGNADGNDGHQWYYLHTDGKYYPVHRDYHLGSGNVRAMWICLDYNHPENRKYLSGTGLADTFDSSITNNTTVIYTGTLYKGYTQGNVGANYFYKQGDAYYPVSQANVSGTYQLSVTIGGTTYYLNGTGLSIEPVPYAANIHVPLYFGDLYYHRTHHRKGDYVKEAVDALVDALASDAKLDELDHRLALAQFNSSGWLDGRTATATLPYPYLEEAPVGGENAHLISDFKVISNDANVAAIKESMLMPHTISGVSHYEWGFSLARGLFQRESGSSSGTDIDNNGSIASFEMPTLSGEEHTKYASRPKIVVIVGDCQHNGNNTADDTYINYLKNDYGALVFVVYVNTSTGTPLSNAKAWASREDLVTKVNEFDATLVSAFRNLAREIRKALIELGTEAVVQDVIADGFEIPAPATGNIKVYTADYVSGKQKDEMTFAAPAASALVPTVGTEAGRPMVRVSGFDFSENYCGTVGGVPHGKKLILEIEIERTTAVGGPSAVTNVAASSGIKESAAGAFIANFATEITTSLPVNIQIEKRGLAKGESAVFTVAPVDADGNPITSAGGSPVKPFRAILTGNDGGTPVSSTLKNLNGNCYWLVTEDNWSWDYEVNGGDPSLSSKTQLLNPFVFTNVKQGTTVKSAESKVSNDFSSRTATTVNSREQ